MNDDRDRILARVRRATRALANRSPLPDWDEALCVSRARLGPHDAWENFRENFAAVNGRPMRTVDELAAFLLDNGWTRGYCDPALEAPVGEPLAGAGLDVGYEFDHAVIDEYQFGITRGVAAIAESGSIVLDDLTTSDRLAALAPWVHVAVIGEDQLIETIPEAIRRFGDAPNIVWVTGPSKTADVEGILIEGVHGPGQQVCLLLG